MLLNTISTQRQSCISSNSFEYIHIYILYIKKKKNIFLLVIIIISLILNVGILSNYCFAFLIKKQTCFPFMW